jgi:hypothetical protein
MGQDLADRYATRAAALLRGYHERFGGSPHLPVPVDAIADDLLGLTAMRPI